MNLSDFKCVKCGECCKHLDLLAFAKDMHVNGICKYLKNNLCTIYDDRPWYCNCYKVFNRISECITEDNFVRITIEACNRLRRLAGRK